MPDEVGGRPFPDGDEPDNHHRGAADEEFASVVFDEDFVRSAQIHEPSAVERMLAAAQARAEAEAARPRSGTTRADDDRTGADPAEDRAAGDSWYDPDDDDDPYGRYGGALRPYRGRTRWHRPVAWVLALVMGIGMVALAFSAVFRGQSGGGREPAPPPATSGVDEERTSGRAAGHGGLPHASPDSPAATATAVPRAS